MSLSPLHNGRLVGQSNVGGRHRHRFGVRLEHMATLCKYSTIEVHGQTISSIFFF